MEIIIGVLVIFVIVIVIGKVLKLAFKLVALAFVIWFAWWRTAFHNVSITGSVFMRCKAA